MEHSHSHEINTAKTKTLKISIALNVLFTIIEYIAGFFSGSLALISDATHNLTDVVALCIAYFANKVAGRDSDAKRTYGYGRASIIAALFNTVILVVLAVFICVEAYHRIFHPHPVQGGIVMLLAAGGILVNGVVSVMLFRNKTDLNMKSAFLHQFSDALASVGAFVAGLLIVLTGKTIFDPLISILIAVMLLGSTWSIIKQALHILFEGVPHGIDLAEVEKRILSNKAVKEFHDLHIWAISSELSALSCHILLDNCDMAEAQKTTNAIKEDLKNTFHIEHSTIETELIACVPEH